MDAAKIYSVGSTKFVSVAKLSNKRFNTFILIKPACRLRGHKCNCFSSWRSIEGSYGLCLNFPTFVVRFGSAVSRDTKLRL